MKIIPLSNAQQRIWLEWQLNSKSTAYNNPLLYQLSGKLNVVCLEKALQQIVTEQPALRSYFMPQGGTPKQIINSSCLTTLEIHDATIYCDEEKQAFIHQTINNNVRRPFNLSELPLFRFSLIKINAVDDQFDYLFILNIHHIVVDGFSAQLLIQNISTYYKKLLMQETIRLVSHDMIYCEYIEASRQPTIDQTNAMQFWQKQFNDANIHVDLFQTNASGTKSDEGVRNYFSIPHTLTQQLKQLAKQYKTTDFILLMTSFYVVLSKYANQNDLIIGYPLDVRPPTCRQLFGFFVNNIPLRVHINKEDTIMSLVEQINRKRKEIKPFQITDLSDIIRYVRNLYPSHPDSLYNTSFIRANFALSGLEFPDVTVISKPISTQAAKDDLCLLYDEKDSFEFAIEYKKQHFSPDYIQQIQDAYVLCLESIVKGANVPVQQLHLFQENPQPCLGEETPITENLINKFLAHVAQSPHKIAIMTTQNSISYQQLYDDVAAWSTVLSAKCITEKPVVVCLERTPRLVAVLLALQYLNITYIPIDTGISFERIKSIVTDSEAYAFIYDPTHTPLTGDFPCQLVPISKAEVDTPFPLVPSTHSRSNSHHDLAYIIYTSGSTGVPKGVAIDNNALNNFLHGMATKFLKDDSDVLLAITTVAFDISGLELFLPIWQQKTLFLANQEQHKDPFMIATILDQYPITYLQATPAMWQMLHEINWHGKKNLVALCGGEALSRTLANEILNKVGELWNMYGPTEATIWCSLKRIERNTLITVGKPINNMEMRVLDKAHNILPPYVKGELYIAGIGLAKGYINREQLTKEQFIPCENALGGRLYRVGDIACTTTDGEFIVFGRTDNQIKLNGYRIELGEIESQMQLLEGVHECAVILHQQQLIAYVSIDQNHIFSETNLLISLANFLPDYMVPKRCIQLNKLPLTSSGKIDRKALPTKEMPKASFAEKPSDETEAALLTIWQSILKTDHIGVTDHFYSLGGHSLSASQITAQINTALNTNVTLADVLTHPTIRMQSHLLQIPSKSKTYHITSSNEQTVRLTSAQYRIWFVSKLASNLGQYHMSAQLRITGRLNRPRFEAAIAALIQRHEILRTIITIIDHEPYQHVVDNISIPIDSFPYADQDALMTWVIQPFDTTNHPLWRIGIYEEQSSNHCVIGICLHHVIADGYSVPLFLKELWSIYDTGQSLLSLPTRYIDYANFDNKKAQSPADITFWKNELHACPYLTLPKDESRAENTLTGHAFHSVISKEVWRTIRLFCSKTHVSASTFLMSAFGLLMQNYAQQTDFCIGIPFANREHEAVKNMIGCFMDILPFRMVLNHHHTAIDWIKHVDNQLTRCLSHKGLPFSSLLQHIDLERKDIEAPLFPVVLNIQPNPFDKSYSNELLIDVSPIETNTSKYDLSLEIYFTDEQATCRWEFSDKLFKKSTIEAMSQQFDAIIMDWLESPNNILTMTQSSIPNAVQSAVCFTPNVTTSYREPKTTLQKTIADVWGDVLQINRIGLDDHFFRLGGHSFLAARMISYLAEKLTLVLPMELIFRHSKLADFCMAIFELSKSSKTTEQQAHPNRVALTPNQRQMALISKEKQDDAYHISVLIESQDRLDLTTLEAAFNQILAQHSIYTWHLSDTTLQEAFLSPAKIKIDVISVADDDHFKHAQHVNKKPINIYAAPLVRVSLLQSNHQSLLVTFHHLIGDEWSLELFIEAVLARYHNKETSLLHSNWESHVNPWVNPPTTSIQYWESKLASKKQSHILPTQRNDDQKAMGQYEHVISIDRINACSHIAQQQDTTLYQITLAMFVYFIHQVTFDDTVMFGVTYDRRKNNQLQQLHGYLVNLLPLVCSFDSISDFNTLIAWVKLNYLETLEHIDVDSAFLMEQGYLHKPNIVFNYQHSFALSDSHLASLKWHAIVNDQAKFPITFHLRKQADGSMHILVDYQLSSYNPEFIQSIVTVYATLLNELPNNLQKPLNTWMHANIESKQKALIFKDELIPKLMHVGFAHPTACAITYNNETVSYAVLWNDVNRLANAILQVSDNIVWSHDVIAIILNDRYQNVVCLLAALYVGATFISIDINLPRERQDYLIKDSNARLIIHDGLFANEQPNPRFQLMDDLWSITPVVTQQPLPCDPHTPAYLIYTSGTTGLPKGVIISRGALHSFISALHDALQINATDRVLQFSSVSFDASIWEIFIALYSGARLVIPTENERRVGQSLQQFIYNHSITHAILTPTVLNTLNPDLLPSLRTIASGGEACSVNLLTLWSKYCDFYNAYGPTEATVCVSLGKFTATSNANCMGTPLGNAKLLVVSSCLSPLPIGVMGELLIGGNILAQGYMNQPELTQNKFIQLFNQRWYRTGDIVRQINAHQFEYFGRQDRQVKLRGLRIELSEIETAISLLPGIYSAHCLINQEQIIAYITAESALIEQNILKQLARQLPPFLLPNKIVQLEEIPLLSSGKMDASKLKSSPAVSKVKKTPQNDIEQALHDLWCRTLHLPTIDIEADFFTLGGNSLQAMSLAFEIETFFSMNFSLQNFYTNGTIELQRMLIESQKQQDNSMHSAPSIVSSCRFNSCEQNAQSLNEGEKTMTEAVDSLDNLMAQLSEDERKELLKSLEQA